jgi:drug/metabolite transporter (DMT)-like permease
MAKLPLSSLLPSLAVAATITVWAIAFPAIKLALTEMQPLPLASIRYAMATCFAAVWLLWKRPGLMPIADLVTCVACGVLGAAGYSVLLNLGQVTVSAGAASFLIKTESIWMAILAVLMLREAFNVWAWTGTLIGFGGIGLIANAQPGGIALGGGAAFVLAAAICSAIGFVLQRKLVQQYGALHVACIMLIAAAVTLFPWLPTAISEMRNASAATVSWVVFLGVLPTAVGQICWSYALGHFGAARAGNFLYLVAPLATLLAWVMYGEVVSVFTIVGGILVLCGVILVNTRGRGGVKQL